MNHNKYLFGSTNARTALAATLLLSNSALALAGVALNETFTAPDGLLTNEYAHWNPTSADAKISNAWDMTSGSLFLRANTGWSGVPDSCSPDATSSNCTDSNVFRLNTKQKFAGNTKVSLAIKQNKEIHDSACNTHDTCWHGAHVWLRYKSQYDLYYASIQRADGNVVIKRKAPCGTDNSGTYFVLGSTVLHNWQVNQWHHYSVTVQTNADNSVTIKLFDDDTSPTVPVVSATDRGGVNNNWSSSCTTEGKYPDKNYPPLAAAGAVGLRGDFADMNIDNFVVSTDGAPSVSITSPVNGQTVSGTINVAADAADDVKIGYVQFYLDGALAATATSSPYVYFWNTASAAAGAHTLQAMAYDSAGNSTQSAPVQVTTAGASAPADTTKPTVSLASPAAGQVIAGLVNVVANASDNVGVTRVEFYVDGALKYGALGSPFAFALDTKTLVDGSHQLAAKAYDAAGNQGSSAGVGVTVANSTGSSGTSPGLAVSMKTTSTWDGGYCAAVSVKNTTTQPLTWMASMTVTGKVTSVWDAQGAQSGTTLTMRGMSWNAVLQPGSRVTPGFCATTKR